MTLKEILRSAKTMISPRDADIIVSEVLGFSQVELITKEKESIDQENREKIFHLVSLRQQHQSISEMFQKKHFFNLEFTVSSDVLTPRPETEFLVEFALSHLSNDTSKKRRKVIDIGTGSGCILLSIVHEYTKNPEIFVQDLHFLGVDISSKALDIAKKNTIKNIPQEHFKTLEFRSSHLLENITAEELNNALIVTNLPYIPQSDELWMEKEVLQGDPALALFSGEDGLDLYKEFFRSLSRRSEDFYGVVFEFDPPQKIFLQDFLQKLFPYRNISFHSDLSGKIRFGSIL